MIVSVALCILGLGVICWMLFTLAVYALPVWLATMSGLYLHGAGFGTLACGSARPYLRETRRQD
jgi:hypothetical protein